tara:strand:+ start:1827 stop:2015 length:189 start_codon:yes stop_codon:yes gene_type:complete
MLLIVVGRDEDGGGERGGDAKSADWNLVFGVWSEESQPSADGSNILFDAREVVVVLLWRVED